MIRYSSQGMAVLLGAIGLLAGCTSMPPRDRPSLPPSTRYTAQPLQIEAPPAGPGQSDGDRDVQTLALGAELDHDWWQLFQSAAINDVVQRSLAGNRDIMSATATLSQAQELVTAQQGARRPSVAITSGTGRQKIGRQFIGPLFALPPFSYVAVGTAVSYTVDIGGLTSHTIEQGNAQAGFEQQQLHAAQLAVTGSAVTQLLNASAARAQIAVVEAIVSNDRESLDLMQQALAAGAIPHSEIVDSQSRVAADDALLPPLRQDLGRAEHALAVLMGQTPANATLPTPALSDITLPRQLPAELPSELAHRRPDILAAEAQLTAAYAAVGAAHASFYPRITLSASAGRQSGGLGALFNATSGVFGLAGELSQPIFNSGTLHARERAAQAAMHATAAAYEQTVLTAFGQVADSLQALDSDAELFRAESASLDSAHQTEELATISRQQGSIGRLQLLEAQRAQLLAQRGLIHVRAQRLLDTVQLFLALGGARPQ